MQAPTWRIWLTALLIILWVGLGIRLYTIKNDPLMALLCAVMALMNAYFLYQMTYGWRSKKSAQQATPDKAPILNEDRNEGHKE